MIESKKYVPGIFRESRDYKALLKLLDIVTCVQKSDVDNIVSLINPDRCPDKYLPLLASYVGYSYDYNLPYDTNRNIIKYYPNLIRLRGSEAGIKLAAAVAINSSDSRYSIQSSSNLVNISYDKDRGLVMVYIYYADYLNKINDLIDVVRPVGLNCIVVDSNAVRASEDVNIEDSFTNYNMTYDVTSFRYKVTNNNNESELSMKVPLMNGYYDSVSETIEADSFDITIPILFDLTYKYTINDNEEVSVTDRVIKCIKLEDDNSGTLSYSSGDSFIINNGEDPDTSIDDAFSGMFESGSIDHNTGELSIKLQDITDGGNGIVSFSTKIISVQDAIANYYVNHKKEDTTVRLFRSSRIRNEIGFGQVNDYSDFSLSTIIEDDGKEVKDNNE